MTDHHLLGIDYGTESCRVGIFTADGRPVTFAATPYPTHRPKPGWAEQSPKDWWNALVASTRQAMAQRGLMPEQIAGIGYDATSYSLVPTDANGNRALRSVCVIDEANRILGSKLPGLANLIRLGRSKGAAVMLISQAPDDFAGEDDDFLSNMGFIACFTTTANASQVKRIFGSGASLAALKKGEALVKTQGSERANKVVCWQ